MGEYKCTEKFEGNKEKHGLVKFLVTRGFFFPSYENFLEFPNFLQKPAGEKERCY